MVWDASTYFDFEGWRRYPHVTSMTDAIVLFIFAETEAVVMIL